MTKVARCVQIPLSFRFSCGLRLSCRKNRFFASSWLRLVDFYVVYFRDFFSHGARQITSSFRSVCGSTLETLVHKFGPTDSGDDNGDGDGDGEEKIPQLSIYKLPINRPSGRILVVVVVVVAVV